MKPEIKKLWVDALRSGDYQKGTGTLRRRLAWFDSSKCAYCALGVLCDLYIKETGAVRWELTDQDYYSISDVDFNRSGSLPTFIMEWAGLVGDDPYMSYMTGDGEEQLSVSEFNDQLGMSFPTIADYIERQL